MSELNDKTNGVTTSPPDSLKEVVSFKTDKKDEKKKGIKKSTNNTCSIVSIPYEVLCELFLFLPYKDIISILHVCKDFVKAVDTTNNRFWKRMCIQKYNTLLFKADLHYNNTLNKEEDHEFRTESKILEEKKYFLNKAKSLVSRLYNRRMNKSSWKDVFFLHRTYSFVKRAPGFKFFNAEIKKSYNERSMGLCIDNDGMAVRRYPLRKYRNPYHNYYVNAKQIVESTTLIPFNKVIDTTKKKRKYFVTIQLFFSNEFGQSKKLPYLGLNGLVCRKESHVFKNDIYYSDRLSLDLSKGMLYYGKIGYKNTPKLNEPLMSYRFPEIRSGDKITLIFCDGKFNFALNGVEDKTKFTLGECEVFKHVEKEKLGFFVAIHNEVGICVKIVKEMCDRFDGTPQFLHSNFI